jgi:acetyl esterase/lipase
VVGYLITAAIAAVVTALSLWPPRPARSSPSNPVHWLTFLPNELPAVLAAWLVAATAQAWAGGDLGLPLGAAGLGLAGLTLAGLAVVARRGARAGAAVDGALAAAGMPARARPGSWLRALLTPLPLRPRAVARVRNVAYGPAGRGNLLDVYRRRSRPAGAPVLVHLHGGAFRSGRKSWEGRLLLHRLARSGWVCVSANYRLRPATIPDQLADVRAVLAWVREHGAEHGADAATLVVAGSSAGGNLALRTALAEEGIAAVVCLYGYYGGVEPGEAPPAFVAHGDNDTLVLVEDARRMVAGLRRASAAPVVYAELPGGQHTFDLVRSPRSQAVVKGIAAFAAAVLSTSRTPPPRTRRPSRARG